MDKGTKINTKPDLTSYYANRLEGLSRSVVDLVSEFLGPGAVDRHREFQNRVERELNSGARFVRRKRQPS